MARTSRKRRPRKSGASKPVSSPAAVPRRGWWLAAIALIIILVVGGWGARFFSLGSGAPAAGDGAASRPVGITDVHPRSMAAQAAPAVADFTAKWRQIDNPQSCDRGETP